MNLRAFLVVCLTLTGAVVAAAAQAANPATDAGLVAVQTRDLDEFYVRPNADLAGYRKILVDPARVAFRDDFNKNVTDSRGFLRRLYPGEVAQIASDTAANLGDAVATAFKARGYEIATGPGPGVLRLSPSAVDLFINAPDARPTGEYKSFTVDSGEATLVLEARDSVSGTLLGRVVDHRRADETTRRVTRTTTVQQNFWLDTMFSRWAATCAKALEATPAAKLGYATQR
jgi:hypothetical protein